MAPPLSFGVELEFTMAILVDEDRAQNPPQTPILRFTPTQEDYGYQTRYRPSMDEYTALEFLHTRAAKRHIRNTIRSTGINISMADDIDYFATNNTVWELVEDPSVVGRYGTQYLWLSLEIRSPAYWYTQDALAVIQRICKLLKDTYHVETNRSCGLHVHVAQGDKPIDFSTTKRLLAFAWAFEHQISRLHPLHRLENDYAQSARDTGRIAIKNVQKYGSRIAPIAGVGKILAIPDIKELADLCSEYRNIRYYKMSSYNIRGPVLLSRGVRDEKPTIEFRQHEGTLDGVAVVMWIQTIIGIVNFLYDVHPTTLGELFLKCQDETWEKLGDGKDLQRERDHGPILAERDFTIIHLLQYIGLDAPAAYYETKWHKHPKETVIQSIYTGEPWMKWEYESETLALDPESDEYRSTHGLRQLWDIMRVVHANDADIMFVHDDPMWPAHTYLKEDWDRLTDYSTDPEVASPMRGSADDDTSYTTSRVNSSLSEAPPRVWRPSVASITEVPEVRGKLETEDIKDDPISTATGNQNQENSSNHSSQDADLPPPISAVRAQDRFSMSTGSDIVYDQGSNSSLWAVVSTVSSLRRQVDAAIAEQLDTPNPRRELSETPSEAIRRQIEEAMNEQWDVPLPYRESPDTPSDIAIRQAITENATALELSPRPLNITARTTDPAWVPSATGSEASLGLSPIPLTISRRRTASLIPPSFSLSEDDRYLAEFNRQIKELEEEAGQHSWQQDMDVILPMRWYDLPGVVDPTGEYNPFAAGPSTPRRRRQSSSDVSPKTKKKDRGEKPAFE